MRFSFLVRFCLPGAAVLGGTLLYAADLKALQKGQHLHLAAAGQGLLCDATVLRVHTHGLDLKVTSRNSRCGTRGETVSLPEEAILELAPEDQSTKPRDLSRILLGLGAMAALSAIPLTSSNPETWVVVASPIVPILIGSAARDAIPDRHDYFVLLKCPDPFGCRAIFNSAATAPIDR